MFAGYCFSKAAGAPDITSPESQAVRFIQLSCEAFVVGAREKTETQS